MIERLETHKLNPGTIYSPRVLYTKINEIIDVINQQELDAILKAVNEKREGSND